MENWSNLSLLIGEHNKSTERNKQNTMLLIDAIIEDDRKIIKELLQNGASLNSFEETTPLIAAIKYDNFELVKLFVELGASISYKPSDISGMDDAVWECVKNKKYEMLEYFIDKKCKLSRSENRETLLIYATKATDVKAVELILKHYNIQVDERDGEGLTAFHHNVQKDPQTPEDIMIGKMLMAAGADINSRTLDNISAKELGNKVAQTSIKHTEIEKQLESKIISKPKVNKI